MKKSWLVAIVIALIIILGLAIIVQLQKGTNSTALWAYNFLTGWANVLSSAVTVLLAFTAFWVILETRQFRYLDDKTNTIASLNKWASKTFRNLATFSHFVTDTLEFKKNFTVCRAELLIREAESIPVFASRVLKKG